jgi:hypothetical protein
MPTYSGKSQSTHAYYKHVDFSEVIVYGLDADWPEYDYDYDYLDDEEELPPITSPWRNSDTPVTRTP